MTDVWKILPPFEYRGNKYPITSREVYFQHEGARHKLQYRDGEFIEQLGVQGLTFSYTLPMRQDIARGPYRDLFTVGYPLLFRDALNRSRGELYDPLLGGPFNVVPTMFRDTSDANRRDGTDVAIEFVRSLSTTDLEIDPVVTIEGLKTEAGALDAQLPGVQEFEQFISESGGTDPFSAVAGLLAQVQRQGKRIGQYADDLAFKCAKLDKQITATSNPQLWGIQDSARSLRFAAIKLKEQGDNPVQKVVQIVTKASQTVGATAAELGMTLEAFLKLNPGLAASPIIPPGTAIRRTLRS